MKIIAWNCQGINNALRIRALRVVIRSNKPECIFLSETRTMLNRIQVVANSIDFANFFTIELRGAYNGLAII